MTLAGLNTINLSAINTFQQFLLFLLIILGSAILVSIVVVHVRRKAFEERFKSVIEQRGGRRLIKRLSFSRSRTRVTSGERAEDALSVASPPAGGTFQEKPTSNDGAVDLHTFVAQENGGAGMHEEKETREEHIEPPISPVSVRTAGRRETSSKNSFGDDGRVVRRITFAPATSPGPIKRHSTLFSMQGVGAHTDISNHPKRSRSTSQELSRIPENGQPAVENQVRRGFEVLSGILVGRNSQFSNLTLAEREQLGGVEYRAVSILAVVVPVYFVLWQLLGCIGLGAYVAMNRSAAAAVNSENPWYLHLHVYIEIV